MLTVHAAGASGVWQRHFHLKRWQRILSKSFLIISESDMIRITWSWQTRGHWHLPHKRSERQPLTRGQHPVRREANKSIVICAHPTGRKKQQQQPENQFGRNCFPKTFFVHFHDDSVEIYFHFLEVAWTTRLALNDLQFNGNEMRNNGNEIKCSFLLTIYFSGVGVAHVFNLIPPAPTQQACHAAVERWNLLIF